MKKTLAVDMDDVLAEFISEWVKVVNEKEGENVRLEEIQSWNIANYFKCGKKIYEHLSYELYISLPVMKDSVEVLQKLNEKYNVYITTSATEFTESLVAKIEWLEKNFPFIKKSNIVLCGNKAIIKADIMIDDGVHNLEGFEGMHLLFDAPHNKNNENFTRVYSWKNIENILL